MRYVMWIAEFSESSNLWTHLAPLGIPRGAPVWVSWNTLNLLGLSTGEGLDFGGFCCWPRLKPAPPKWISGVCCADPRRDKYASTSWCWPGILLPTVFEWRQMFELWLDLINLDLKSGETTRWT